MIGNPFQGGLLGMGGLNGLAPEPQGLLGQYYDQDAVRKATIKNMLMLGGLGLMGGGWEGAAKGAATAAISTPNQYRDMAMDAFQMDQSAQDQAWQDEQRQRQRDQWGAVDNLVQGVDDPYAKAFPEQYAEMQFRNRYAAPEPPKVETFYDEKTGQQYKAQWDAQTNNWVPIGGRKAESNGITIGPDGTVQVGGQKTTEGDRRAILLANQTVSQEPTIMQTFESMASVQNTMGANIPGGRYFMTPEGQAAQDALSNVIGNWLYLTSGATAPAEEVRKRTAEVTPTAMDSKETVALKRARLQSIFDGMKQRAGIPISQGEGASQESGGGADPLAEARAAIAAGADPNAVKQRLQQMGIDPSRL